MPVLPGLPPPLGVELTSAGAYVSLVSASADAVSLCLIAEDGSEEGLPLAARDFGMWHGLVPGLSAGQRYGFRVDGPYDPARGLRFDPDKLLLDQYARAITGDLEHGPGIYGHGQGDPMRPSGMSRRRHHSTHAASDCGGSNLDEYRPPEASTDSPGDPVASHARPAHSGRRSREVALGPGHLGMRPRTR